MKIYYEYLKDKTFLKKMTKMHVKEYFVKITILNWKEDPLQQIQGKVISGNISINGNSSIRRTASLTMYTDRQGNNIKRPENIISINKKICMEIGYVNTTDEYKNYDILWFPMGVYIIINSSLSFDNSGITISLELKDKMCLLNGQCGGTFPASTILDTYQTIDGKGEKVISRPTIYKIIQQLVNHFGKEQLGKILISDLDNKVKQVMRWTGSVPLYMVKNGTQYIITTKESKYAAYKEKSFTDVIGSPFEYNRDVGFTLTDFTYPGSLVMNPGDTVVTALDKIRETLGNYEYFYDVDGNFVFQEIKNFLNKTQSRYIQDVTNFLNIKQENIQQNAFVTEIDKTNSDPYIFDMNGNKTGFDFDTDDFILSYSSTPQYGNIKNDFVIWGARKNSNDGKSSFLRYHLAIDEKPQTGNSYRVLKYYDPVQDRYKWTMAIPIGDPEKDLNRQDSSISICDDDEKVFSDMSKEEKDALDKTILSVDRFYEYKYIETTQKDGVEIKESKSKIYRWQWDSENNQYDLKDVTEEVKKNNNGYNYQAITTNDWRTELLFQGLAAEVKGRTPNDYYAQLLEEWPKIYDIEKGKGKEADFWPEVKRNPSSINYYLDFIDTPELEELSVENIGRRSFVVDRGTNVNCVFQPIVPDLILGGVNSIKDSSLDRAAIEKECTEQGYSYYRLPASLYDGLQVGGVLNSAYEEVKQELNHYINYNETVSITTLPLFFLQPNTLITLNNKETDISGRFLINSLSFSLDNSSVLNINATKNITRE